MRIHHAVSGCTRSRRRRSLVPLAWRLALAGTLLAGLTLLGCMNQTENALTKVEQRIRDAGQPVTLEELDAYYPAVPDDRNAALIYEKAFEQFEAIDPEGATTAELLEQLNSTSKVVPDTILERVESHLSSCDEVLRLLERASQYPESRYSVDLTRGISMELPHLAPLRNCARLEALRGALAVRDGRFDEFADSQRCTFAMTRSLRYEPYIISQLVRIAVHGIAADALEDALRRSELPDHTLSRLADLYGNAEDTEAMVRTYVGERCIAADAIYRMWLGDVEEDWPEVPKPSLKASVWIALEGGRERIATGERLAVLHSLTPLANASDLSWPERMKLSEQIYESTKDLPRIKPMARTMLPALVKGVGAFARDAAVLRMAHTALAIERYRSVEGIPPAHLDQLVPRYLSAPTLDPFDGESMRYQRHKVGYTIYSVYTDLEDDGGVKAEKDESGEWHGDWVFEVRR